MTCVCPVPCATAHFCREQPQHAIYLPPSAVMALTEPVVNGGAVDLEARGEGAPVSTADDAPRTNHPDSDVCSCAAPCSVPVWLHDGHCCLREDCPEDQFRRVHLTLCSRPHADLQAPA